MDILAFGLSMVFSGLIRDRVEEGTASLIFDTLALATLTAWNPPTWTALIVSFFAFLGLCVYESNVEYTGAKAKHEKVALHTSGERDANSPSTLGLGSGLCPVAPSKPRKPETRCCSKEVLQMGNSPNASMSKGCSRDQSEPKELHGKPIIYPCDVSHTRTSPFKDKFLLSTLYCGIPVGLHACYSPILSVDEQPHLATGWQLPRAWFNMRSQDFASRGQSHLSVSQKLREYLLGEVGVPRHQ